MTSQWRHKVGYFENDPFSCLFSSVSIERGRGQILYFLSVYTDNYYVIYKILILSTTSLYTN